MTSRYEDNSILCLNHYYPATTGGGVSGGAASGGGGGGDDGDGAGDQDTRLPPSPSHGSSTSMQQQHFSTKPNPKLLSFFLQVIVMAVVMSLFFLFVGIAAIVLIHICLAGGALHRRSRLSQTLNSMEEDEDCVVGLSPKDLQKLPCFNFGTFVESMSSSPSAGDCAVCLEGFREGERCRILPHCKHVFHANCVDSWLIKTPACPICRGTVVELGLSLAS